jgi:hypothetical protein
VKYIRFVIVYSVFVVLVSLLISSGRNMVFSGIRGVFSGCQRDCLRFSSGMKGVYSGIRGVSSGTQRNRPDSFGVIRQMLQLCAHMLLQIIIFCRIHEIFMRFSYKFTFASEFIKIFM